MNQEMYRRLLVLFMAADDIIVADREGVFFEKHHGLQDAVVHIHSELNDILGLNGR